MECIVVIGTGVVGSRHVQGLVRGPRPLEVIGLDPSPDARALVEERVEEVGGPRPGTHVSLMSSIAELPSDIDVAIVATTADHRRPVVEDLFERASVGAVILEKFSFQSEEDFDAVSDLLETTGTPAWVNCPRRQWPDYRRLQEQIEGQGRVELCVETGDRFGIATTAVHFLDLAAFLSGQTTWTLTSASLDQGVVPATRKGMVEFTGALEGTAPDGSRFSYASRSGGEPRITVDIGSRGLAACIDETAREVSIEVDGASPDRRPFECPFQSELTGDLASDLLTSGRCDLPAYEESSKLQKAILRPLLEHYRAATGASTTVCPIT